MNNFIKATVRKLTELPWEDFKNLFTWPCTSKVQADNPNLLVAKATKESGAVVAYMSAEKILLIDGYTPNPSTTDDADTRTIGQALEAALAQAAGACRLWVLLPESVPTQPDEKIIRVFERRVPQYANTQPMGESLKHTPTATNWVN